MGDAKSGRCQMPKKDELFKELDKCKNEAIMSDSVFEATAHSSNPIINISSVLILAKRDNLS